MNRYYKGLFVLISVICFVGCRESGREDHVHQEYKLEEALKHENVVPVAIIGSGPAGLSAALYIARAGMKSFVFAGPQPCGQLTQTTYIENWPGREKVLGMDLMQDIKKQAESFGATIINDTITSIDAKSWPFSITTDEGRKFKALSIILSTGADPKRLNIPGESENWGKGVTTCAVCDAPFFKKKNVVISGGGDSAVEMVFELAPYVNHATVMVRGEKMRAAVAGQERLKDYPNVTVEYHKEIKHIYAEKDKVVAIDVFDNKRNATEKRPIDGVFLAIGHTPRSEMIKDQVPLDSHGYIKMRDRSQETLVCGIFAAGEIQDPSYRQAIVASGEGVKAALDVTSFLYGRGFTTDIGHKLDQHFFETFSDAKVDLKEITENDELYDQVLKAKGLVMLDFYSTTCPGCMAMLPALEAVAHKFQDKLKIIKVNYDKVYKTIFKELWHEHEIKVRKLPTILVFKDGKLLEMTTKVMSRRELVTYVQKFL